MPKVKSLYVIQCRDYVQEHHGEEGLQRVAAAMAPPWGEIVYSPELMASDWIDMAAAVEHARGYDRAYPGAREWEAATKMITELVAKHFNGMYRTMFARAVTPMNVLEKSSRLWSRFYDEGESRLEVHSPTSVTKHVIGGRGWPRDHERLTSPYYEELLRQAGARDVAATHVQCTVRGDDHCATLLNWRDPS